MRSTVVLLVLVGCGEVKNTTPDAASHPDGATIDQTGIDAPLDADLHARIVFMTSSRHTGNLGGLAGADAICQARAQAATIPGTFKAWLADANLAPATRMTHGLGPYQLVTGTAIAQSWTDLVDGMIAVPVNRTETGTLLGGSGCDANQPATCSFICEGGEFWSNVAADGTRATGVVDCTSWTGAGNGTAGNVGKTTAQWTAGSCTPIGCGSPSLLPIMCVQQ